MSIAMSVIFWIFLVADVIYNILVLVYSYNLVSSLHKGNPDDWAENLEQVDKNEMTGMKFGPVELVRIIIAGLIKKGLINIRETINKKSSSMDWERDYYATVGGSRSTYSYTYKYRAAHYRDPEGLSQVEQDVLAALSQFKSAEFAARELSENPLFKDLRRKMHDFLLVYEMGYIEKGIELFYNINYALLGATVISLTFMSYSPVHEFILILTGLNSLFGIITRLIFYRGKLSFNHIYPGAIPTPAYKKFIEYYEEKISPLEGSKPYHRILTGDE